jgi:hypothetical protein
VPGRRTKDEEINLYLESLGIDRAELEATGRMFELRRNADDPDRPRTAKDLAAFALDDLVKNYENLSGSAKVQAYREIQRVAKEEAALGEEILEEPLLVDVLEGVVTLTPQRKREILQRELEKLDAEREQILEVLDA